MRKTRFMLCLALATAIVKGVSAQQSLKLHYDCDRPVAFSKVNVIDKRSQGQLLGYVQKGAFNRLEKISFDGNLADSLAKFFQQDNAAVKSDKELVFVLEEFFMSEWTGAMSEQGKLKLSVRFFVRGEDSRYSELLTVDSNFICTGFDVTHKMLRSASEQFCRIAGELGNQAAVNTNSYTWDELHNLDSVEMQRMPIFTGKPAAGIYRSYNSFKMNQPDEPADIAIENSDTGHIKVYRLKESRRGDKKKTWLSTRGVYAVSDGNRFARNYEEHWYDMKKAGYGFYFDCPASFSNNAAMWGGAIGGIAGMAIANSIDEKNRKIYRFHINPRTGKAAPVAIVGKL